MENGRDQILSHRGAKSALLKAEFLKFGARNNPKLALRSDHHPVDAIHLRGFGPT